MNERIKELAEQAGLQQRIWNSLGKELPMWQEDPDNPGLAKFAELIVKECLSLNKQVCKELKDENLDIAGFKTMMNLYNVSFRNKVEEHFGVEE